MRSNNWNIILCTLVFIVVLKLSRTEAKSLHIPRQTSESSEFSWLKYLKSLREEVKNCVKLKGDTTWNCFKTGSLHSVDGLLSARVIPIWDGVRLVNVKTETISTITRDADNLERQDLQHLTWFDRLAMRLSHTLETHMLQVNFKELADAYMRILEKQEELTSKNSTDSSVGSGRHRKYRQNMMITMMFGVTALGAVLVPLGFQMLSIVSGKALLLAKMALLLASINGLKRVANSGVHYGLYHVPGEHYNGYYDRGDVHHPRNVASLAVTAPQTFEFGYRR